MGRDFSRAHASGKNDEGRGRNRRFTTMRFPHPLSLLILTPVLAGAQPSAPAILRTTVFQWGDLIRKPIATGVGRRWDVANLPTPTIANLESHITELRPGKESHPPHQHAREEFIVVKEGTLDVFINGKISRVGPGSVYFLASNDLHNVTNVGDNPATYLVFNFSTATTLTAPGTPAAESAGPGKLASSTFVWGNLVARPTAYGERRNLFASPTVTCANFECHATTLNPGESPHPAHRHPDEELIVVKDGTLEVTLNGTPQRAGPGSIVFISSNDEHVVRNPGPDKATYFDFRFVTDKTPAPGPVTE